MKSLALQRRVSLLGGRCCCQLRFALLGPATGAALGFIDATAAVLVWVLRGQPDFLFRGWNGVFVDYMVTMLGGAVVGIPYGGAVLLFERLSDRRRRLHVVLPISARSRSLLLCRSFWPNFTRVESFLDGFSHVRASPLHRGPCCPRHCPGAIDNPSTPNTN
jgi:hypothetical protein